MDSFHFKQVGSYVIIICIFHNHRLMQVGRQLRRSLIQPPAQRRANISRPGCPGLCPDRSCKTPRTEFPQCLWEASSTPNCPQTENCFLIQSLYFPCSNLWSLFIILLPSTYVSTFLISLLILEIRLMSGCPQNLFSNQMGPDASASPCRSYIPAPQLY